MEWRHEASRSFNKSRLQRIEMKIVLAAVGKAKKSPELALFEHFTNRLKWKISVKEVEEKKPLPKLKRMEREAELLLKAIPSDAIVVALDERGKEITSRDFAIKISNWRDNGKSKIAFLIGGADGHGKQIAERADFTLSFGKMVWPHMMIRAMLAEQLYRAGCILDNHPYHRD